MTAVIKYPAHMMGTGTTGFCGPYGHGQVPKWFARQCVDTMKRSARRAEHEADKQKRAARKKGDDEGN